MGIEILPETSRYSYVAQTRQWNILESFSVGEEFKVDG